MRTAAHKKGKTFNNKSKISTVVQGRRGDGKAKECKANILEVLRDNLLQKKTRSYG
jgi:hypothetical protein